jgi:hypothetical protein
VNGSRGYSGSLAGFPAAIFRAEPDVNRTGRFLDFGGVCRGERRPPDFPHPREFLRAWTRTVLCFPQVSSASSGGISIAETGGRLPPAIHGATMTEEHGTLMGWTRLIQAEYLEMPGLNLTKPQVRRLWGLDPQTCDVVLDTLVATAVLKKTPHQTYSLVR